MCSLVADHSGAGAPDTVLARLAGASNSARYCGGLTRDVFTSAQIAVDPTGFASLWSTSDRRVALGHFGSGCAEQVVERERQGCCSTRGGSECVDGAVSGTMPERAVRQSWVGSQGHA